MRSTRRAGSRQMTPDTFFSSNPKRFRRSHHDSSHILLALFAIAQATFAADTDLPLAGTWRFQWDRADVGSVSIGLNWRCRTRSNCREGSPNRVWGTPSRWTDDGRAALWTAPGSRRRNPRRIASRAT